MGEAERRLGRVAIGQHAVRHAAEVMREAFLHLEAPIGLVSGDEDDWSQRVREAALATLLF